MCVYLHHLTGEIRVRELHNASNKWHLARNIWHMRHYWQTWHFTHMELDTVHVTLDTRTTWPTWHLIHVTLDTHDRVILTHIILGKRKTMTHVTNWHNWHLAHSTWHIWHLAQATLDICDTWHKQHLANVTPDTAWKEQCIYRPRDKWMSRVICADSHTCQLARVSTVSCGQNVNVMRLGFSRPSSSPTATLGSARPASLRQLFRPNTNEPLQLVVFVY